MWKMSRVWKLSEGTVCVEFCGVVFWRTEGIGFLRKYDLKLENLFDIIMCPTQAKVAPWMVLCECWTQSVEHGFVEHCHYRDELSPLSFLMSAMTNHLIQLPSTISVFSQHTHTHTFLLIWSWSLNEMTKSHDIYQHDWHFSHLSKSSFMFQ